VAEDSSRIAQIHFVCRPIASFACSTHALQIIARCDRSEPTGEARMFMQRDCGRQGHAVSLGILTDTILATTAFAAQTAEPFVFIAYRNLTGGQNLLSGDAGSAHTRWRRVPVSGCAMSLPCARVRMGTLGQPRPLN
jgi:hypothetical protein